MSNIWNNLIECQHEIIKTFNIYATEYAEPGLALYNNNNWVNRVWHNEHVRRAHIDVVDARATKGLWMMHVCIFPELTNPGPIYGFDVIAGKNKMTGAFHDFSASADKNNPMIDRYKDSVADFIPTKQRKLPEWATNIFTDKMLAAGNVNTDEEATSITSLAISNLHAYFDEIAEFTGTAAQSDVIQAQDWYCHNQQQNPHTPRTMKSLGLNEEDVDMFCSEMLFPKINT